MTTDNDCPFCGETEPESLPTKAIQSGRTWRSHVSCENCGATGPIHHDGESKQSAHEGAEYLWRDRPNTRADLAVTVKPLVWQPIETAPESDTILLWAKDWLEPETGYRGVDSDFYDVNTRCFLTAPTHWVRITTPDEALIPTNHQADLADLQDTIDQLTNDPAYLTAYNAGRDSMKAEMAAVLEKAANIDMVYPSFQSIEYQSAWDTALLKMQEAILALTPDDASAALDKLLKEAERKGQIKAGGIFTNDGNAEDRWCEDQENACPCCGGSGHKDDTAALQAREDAVWNEALKEVLDVVNICVNDENTRSDLEHAIIARRKEVK